jgi:Uma2 family endonuclease
MTPKVLELASKEGRRPTWEMALIYPDQGGWKVNEYLDLDIGRQVEFSKGYLEFQAMPNEKHQAVVIFFVMALKAFASRAGGRVTMAPFPMRLWEDKYREPDVLFMKEEHLNRSKGKFWEGADLVLEVVRDSSREHDLETKRTEYAGAGIPEYWIVDPERGTVTVLTLEGAAYTFYGEFRRGQKAASKVLSSFEADVTAVLEAE